MDPTRYDVGWWRDDWKPTRTQGAIINAGGIVAYYPSRVPLHRPPQRLGKRDLFGELCHAAHEAGLVALARLDSNRPVRASPDSDACRSSRGDQTGHAVIGGQGRS